MQTRTDLAICAERDRPFAVSRQSAGAPLAAALTIILAFALAIFCVSTGWPL